MSARGLAPPGGIIVFWSQNISAPSAPRSVSSAIRPRRTDSSAGALIRPPCVDVVEQGVRVGEREVLCEVGGRLLARGAAEGHVEGDDARAGLVGLRCAGAAAESGSARRRRGSGSGSGSSAGREVLGLGLRLAATGPTSPTSACSAESPSANRSPLARRPSRSAPSSRCSSSRRRSMPSAASPTRPTWSSASRPASPRSSAALRSAASRICRTCSDVPAESVDRSAWPPRGGRGPSRRRPGAGARRRPPCRSRGGRSGSRRAGSPLAPRALR